MGRTRITVFAAPVVYLLERAVDPANPQVKPSLASAYDQAALGFVSAA